MKKAVTIKDVARHAGLSVGTVSMALNNSSRIADETKEAVRKAVTELGYRANPFGRFLSTNTSLSIGCLVPDLTNPFYGQLLESIQGEVEKKGYSLLIGLTNEKSNTENDFSALRISRRSEKILLLPWRDLALSETILC